MARAGKSRLGSSGLRAAADDLGREQKLRAAAGQGAALAGALPENLLTRRPQGQASARFSCAAPAPAARPSQLLYRRSSWTKAAMTINRQRDRSLPRYPLLGRRD